jgi:hypothetical protein
MREKSHVWKYKDANRVWWRLEVEMSREGEDCLDIDNPDHWWSYKLVNDDTNTVILVGEIWEQYDIMPNITRVLSDIQFQFNNLFFGMAKYCKD